MAAEVHSDLSLIQDEDVLRRMWADTDDFGRKKEIRGRMYKLREQRLRDLYTGGVDRTQVTRKHQTTRHTESIGEQDFMSMKSKEIRDSESPTRDFNRSIVKTNSDNSGYWTSRQENANTTQQLDGGGVMKEAVETSEGSGVIRGPDSETNLALGSEDRHTVVSKNDDNSSYKAEELKHSSKMASTTVSNSGAVSNSKTESQNVVQSHEEKTSSDNSSTTKSWSSSSRTVSSSSKKIVSSTYQSGDTQNLKAITSSDVQTGSEDSQQQLRRLEDISTGLNTDSTSQESRASTVDQFQKSTSNVDRSQKSTSNVERSQQSTSTITSRHYGQHTAEEVTNETSKVNDSTQRVSDSGAKLIAHNEVTTSSTSTNDSQTLKNQSAFAQPELTTAPETKRVVQEIISDANCKNEVISSQVTRAESVKSETESVTNQKIMSEINKLDSYLSSHTPAPSTPASPRSNADVANWTIVSKDNRDNEFTYEPRSRDQDNQGPERPPTSPRSHEKVDKNLSNIDLPKGATEGQYVTTYQSHYTRPDRISIDNSPSHDYFASTLRTSPDRQTPSPNKKTASRGSLDRSSPERKWRQSPRTTSPPNVERASPDRPHSQPGQRSSPERKYRSSPSKTPERNVKKSPTKSPERDVTRKSPAKSPERDVKERKHSTSSYTIERHSTETKKKSDVRTDTKPKRKFSSTQQKELTKARASTPGSSPNSSPTRPRKVKDTSDSDSDATQATYKKSKSDIVKKTDECDAAVVKTIKQQKEESSEYFSEGSVTNEIVKRGQEPSPERSAFTPIKNFRTNPESGAFIIGEKRQIVLESEVREKSVDQSRCSTIVNSSEIENAVEVTETISENEDSVIDSKQITSQPVKTPASRATPEKPTSKIDDSRPSPTKNHLQSTENTVSEVNKTTVIMKSTTKDQHAKSSRTKNEREELRKTAQTDSDTSRSASVSPERKVSSPRKSSKTPSQSSSGPTPQKTPITEARKPGVKQVSKSPERKQPHDGSLSPVRSIKSTERTSKSPSTSPERSPSARSSPERKHTVSSSAKFSDSSSKIEDRRTSSVLRQTTTPQKTPARVPDTPVSKTPRRSSIPKSDKKLSPKNSKDNMQLKPANRSTPATTQPTSRPAQKTPSRSPQKVTSSISKTLDVEQKRATPKTPTTTRTVVTNRTTVKTSTTSGVSRTSDATRPITQNGVRPSPTGTPRKPLASTNKKPASPATTPKRPSPQSTRTSTTQVKPASKPASSPARTTPQKTINKTPANPKLPSKSQVTPKSSSTLVKQDSRIKSKQFIENEVIDVTSDLEDCSPPEYFDVEIVDAPRDNINQKSGTKHTVLNTRRVTNISQDKISQDRKVRKRDSKKDYGSSSSSSSEDETDDASASTVKLDNGMTFGAVESTQDYLNVVVQHPKSSRESSPGYTSERIPVSTTSDDGESNPRYADFISEPEDVEIFDNLRGPRGPIPLREGTAQRIDEEETDVLSRTSVADKVNVFMEAAKQSKETQESHQPIEIDTSHSVRSAKTLFENISKTQATTSQTSKSVNIYENDFEPVTDQAVNVEIKNTVRPDSSAPKDVPASLPKNRDEVDEPLSTKKHTYQEKIPVIEPVILKKKAYETHRKEETTLFKEREIDDNRKTTRKDTPVPEPLDATKPSKKPFERKPSASSADVNSKKNFFERKVQEQSKTVLKNNTTTTLDKSKAEPKTSVNLDSLMRSTVASSVRAQSPDKAHRPVERKRTSEDLNTRIEDVPAGKGRNVETKEKSPTRESYRSTTERRTSTEMSTVRTDRRQSPSKEVPTYLTKSRTPSTPVDDTLGSPTKVRDTSFKTVTTSEEVTTRSTGKFGVTLKKSPSNTKMMPSTNGPTEKKHSVSREQVDIEEITDLETLEAMLVKAVAYEERRRIRAQIRLVKKQLEDEHNRSGNRVPSSSPTKSKAWPPKEKSPERNVTSSFTSRNVKEDSSWTSSSRRSPERKPSSEIKQTTYKETITTTSSRKSPERKLSNPKPRESPERYVSNKRRSQSPERIVHYPSRSSPERKISNQVEKKSQVNDSKDVTTYQATVKTQSTRSVTTSEVKTTSATDSITSSYGVGPTDDNGRPLFGLRALRRTDTSKTLEDGDHHEENVVIEERSESRRTSATSGDILDSTGRPLFGGLRALQSETMPTQTSQLNELVDRNTRLVQGASRMESTKTVMTSHSSMTSDGKVSVKRNVVRGGMAKISDETEIRRILQALEME